MIGDLKIAIAQINPVVGDITHNLGLVRTALDQCDEFDLVVFPELIVCGYPPEDLVLKPSFLRDCMEQSKKFIDTHKGNAAYVLTTPWIVDGNAHNAALFVENGKIKHITFKKNLPNYGVFDEWRVFKPGPMPTVFDLKGHKIGIVICEDIWFDECSKHLKNQGAEIILSPNGSPYHMIKRQMRKDVIEARVRETGLPVLYVNQVGGQDDLVYDGGSMAYNAHGQKIFQAPYCKSYVGPIGTSIDEPPELEAVYDCLKLGLRDYIEKNEFPGIIIGMSGGIDSALSAAIAANAIGADKVRCVMMPSPFTSQDSLDDAKECANLLGVSYEIIQIKNVMKAYEDTVPNLSGLAHENMQARSRGLILMSLSNQTGWMVLTTGNKSEMAVGYATLYGDMCGGFNVLKDVYKTQVYDLCRWRNQQSAVIPERIITKPPTAELRDNQKDQDSLPPYETLDAILKGLIEDDLGAEDVVNLGFDKDTVKKVNRLLILAEYKRRQSAPGPKITTRAFGRDRRYPITNGYRD